MNVSAAGMGVCEDPFTYFADVVSGRIKLPQNGLYALTANVAVVRILKAARESAKTCKTVRLKSEEVTNQIFGRSRSGCFINSCPHELLEPAVSSKRVAIKTFVATKTSLKK